MKRFAIVLAACGTPHKPAPVEPPRVATADAAAAIDAPIVSPRPVVHTSPTRPMIEAPHGGAIATLGVAADGTAAISCDDQGGIRLWPTLDGSVEPRVVDLPQPRELAIGRHGAGFEVALLDDVGGLVIASLDADGRTLQHLSLPPDPAFVGIAMTERGPFGWRSDQTIVQLGFDGVIESALAPEPGQRIAAVAVAGEHAIAIVDAIGADGVATTTRARWLTLGSTLHWGAWIDTGRDLGPVIALSPSGKRLAVMMHAPANPNVPQILVIETATGAVIMNLGGKQAQAIGFFDDDHLALGTFGAVAPIEIIKSVVALDALKAFVATVKIQPLAMAMAPGRAIIAREGELELVTPADIHYLGYELESPSVAAAAPHGGLVIGLNETFALLDASLHAVAPADVLVTKDTRVAELHWLGENDWLVEASSQTDGSTSLSLIDLASRKVAVLRTGVPVVQLMLYEPSTHLVALSLGEAPLLDRMTLRWIPDLGALDKGASITVDGSLAGVDAAGHVFVWQTGTNPGLELAVFDAGKRIGTLPSDGMVALWPDPRGAQVIETGPRSVTLVGIDGTKRWTIPIQSATEALWLDDGGLALVSAAGLARVDPATGAITASRCGWRFSLATKPHPASPRVEPVCVQQLER
jgi:hypothetical protein